MNRIFNKNFLNRNLLALSRKRTLITYLEKGFARNFNNRNTDVDDFSEGGSNARSEESFKIPKYQKVSSINSEVNAASDKLGDILHPTRGKKFDEEIIKPKRGEGESFGDRRPPRRDFGGEDRPRREFGGEDRPPRRDFGNDRPPRREFGGEDRPPRREFGGEDRPPRREFGNDRPPRREFGGEDRPPRREFGGEDRPPRREFGGEDRPPRRDFNREDRPPRSDFNKEDRPPRRDFNREDRPPRSDFNKEDRPPRREFGGEDRAPRRDFGSDRPPRFNSEDRAPRRDFNREERPQRFNSEDRPPRREFGGEDRPKSDFNRDTNERPPRLNRDNNERAPRYNKDDTFDKTQKPNEEVDEGETSLNFNSFAKETLEEEEIYPKRITLADLKNRKKEDKSDPDLIKSNDIEVGLKDTATTNQKIKSQESASFSNKMGSQEKEDISFDFKDTKMDYIYGAHAVEAAVSFNFRKNLDLFVQYTYKDNTPDHLAKIIETAKSKNVKIKYLSREKMDKFTGGRPHNGLVLKSQPRDYIYIKGFHTFSEKYIHKPEGNVLVLLDQIVDPQNFGSVVRSAFFLGSDALLVNKNNKPPISSTVCKVSSGASECVDLFAVKSMKRFLSEAIDKGWTVISTSIEKEHDVQLRLNNEKEKEKEKEKEEEAEVNAEESETNEQSETRQESKLVSKNISLTELHLPKSSNVILVLGSEANGITSDISGVANYNVYIPPLLNKELTGKHPFNIIDSLNVGVSAGIIINNIKTQLKHPKNENTEEPRINNLH